LPGVGGACVVLRAPAALARAFVRVCLYFKLYCVVRHGNFGVYYNGVKQAGLRNSHGDTTTR
jgi:hypothetical protein